MSRSKSKSKTQKHKTKKQNKTQKQLSHRSAHQSGSWDIGFPFQLRISNHHAAGY
jgi:hypothetical protein